jgi:hypothetical protein
MKVPLEHTRNVWAFSAVVAIVLTAALIGLLSPFDSERDGYFARSFGAARHFVEPVRGVP